MQVDFRTRAGSSPTLHAFGVWYGSPHSARQDFLHAIPENSSVPAATRPLGDHRGAKPEEVTRTQHVAPDILNNASFETGFDGFSNWSFNGAPLGATRDSTTPAADGKVSLKHAWTPNPGADAGSKTASRLGGNYDHVWLRFSMRITAPITTIMKFARFYDAGFNANFGGLFLGSGDNVLTFGTTATRRTARSRPRSASHKRSWIDGKWHSIEMEYWRNGDPSGNPTAAFWFDGAPVSATSTKMVRRRQQSVLVERTHQRGGERRNSGKIERHRVDRYAERWQYHDRSGEHRPCLD